MNKKNFAQKLGDWYDQNKRLLPWRETTDPYKVWLSEIILQQTRVAQGLPYYEEFVNRYPTVTSLAGAREEDVLRLWQGLGYYTRARNLHRCAKIIVADFQGEFPRSFKELLALPGIGSYTAAAIASICFKEQVPVVDGNVFRVLSRVFGMEDDTASPRGRQVFFMKAMSLIPEENPDQFNQAMMEFGALHCTPQNPKCDDCTFRRSCVAYANGWQQRLPVKNKKLKIRQRYFYYFILEMDKRWAMQKRKSGDIWQGLYDFYLVETTKEMNPAVLFRKDPKLGMLAGAAGIGMVSEPYHHILSHQKLIARFVTVNVSAGLLQKKEFNHLKFRFYSIRQIDKLPKPALVSRYMKEKQVL